MTNSTMFFLLLLLITIPIMGFFLNRVCQTNQKNGAKLAARSMGIGLILSLVLLVYGYGNTQSFDGIGLKADSLGLLMTTLIFFVSTVVHQFSVNYMAGERSYQSYYDKLSWLTVSAVIMALADHVGLFFMAWCMNNFLLIALMTHKKQWSAAAYSGKLAFQIFFGGAVVLFIAMALMYLAVGSLSISTIIQNNNDSPWILIALLLCIITAMTQSALWPFHRWLMSSLNAPTPVSAIMHAGLVNGGGFLLVRFAPLFSQYTGLLDIIFIFGVISAVLGTLWKLVQSDVKRMLACSTMGQMGFMMMQCGLGLFSAAIAHLIWHGLFKAFLFLSAGSAVMSQKADSQSRTSTWCSLIISSLYGLLGAYSFAWFSGKSFFAMHTSAFLVGFSWIAATQVAHAVLQNNMIFSKHIVAVIATIFFGAIYGCSIHLIEAASPAITMMPHAMHALHWITFAGFLLIWMLLNVDSLRGFQKTNFWKRVYLALLNGSQPHPKTITAIRQFYHY